MRPRFDIGDCRDSLLPLRLVDGFVIESGVDERLIALIGIRVAHIDGCESSIDFHVQKVQLLGKAKPWLSMTSRWRRASIYNPVERAVLEFAELLMQPANGISDQAYDAIRDFLMLKDIARLMVAVSAALMWDHLVLLAQSDPRSRKTWHDSIAAPFLSRERLRGDLSPSSRTPLEICFPLATPTSSGV